MVQVNGGTWTKVEDEGSVDWDDFMAASHLLPAG
jgi:hypothetical protein